MKKMFLLVPAVAFAASLSASTELVSIDSLAIMQKSAEGKELAEKIKKEINGFQEDVQGAQKDLADKQESLSKQAKVLSEEAMQEKQTELVQKRKELEQKFANKEEALRLKLQKWQMSLREKQLKTVNTFSTKQGWPMVIDKNTPGVLFVSNAIDKTDDVLAAVDSAYKTDKVSTKTTKTEKATTKTAMADKKTSLKVA